MDLRIGIQVRPLDRPLFSRSGPNDGCYELLNTVTRGFCGGTIECLGSPPLAPDGCYEAPGVRVCPPAMSPLPVAGQNPFCTEIRVTADCAGPVRCMGTDCASFPSEQSADFSNAVAVLQAAQMAVTDMRCSSAGEGRGSARPWPGPCAPTCSTRWP